MAAVDLIVTARNDEFAARVMMISYKVAQMVSTEDPATPSHSVRVSYAGRVIRGGDNPKQMSAHVISSNPTIAAAIEGNPSAYGANVPDADIEFALSSIWTARANAFAASPTSAV
jgi:hypothetical protein